MAIRVLFICPFLIDSDTEALLVGNDHMSICILTDLSDVIHTALCKVICSSLAVGDSLVAPPLITQRHFLLQLLDCKNGAGQKIFNDNRQSVGYTCNRAVVSRNAANNFFSAVL